MFVLILNLKQIQYHHPHLNFDVETCIESAKTVNPDIKVFQVSATTGEGMQDWYEWITDQVKDGSQQVGV